MVLFLVISRLTIPRSDLVADLPFFSRASTDDPPMGLIFRNRDGVPVPIRATERFPLTWTLPIPSISQRDKLGAYPGHARCRKRLATPPQGFVFFEFPFPLATIMGDLER
jgi:hypothetical protein